MFGLKTHKIGYLLPPGFRPADVVGVQSILGPYPLDRSYYIGPSLEPVEGAAGMVFQPNATYDDCPELDVLVVGDLPDAALTDEQVVSFLRKMIPAAQHVIGISAGVEALVRTGLLQGLRVTSNKQRLEDLRQFGVEPVAEGKPVVDGKFVTAGPSTGMMEAAFLVQEKLRGKNFAKYMELNLEYDPTVQFPLPSNEQLSKLQSSSEKPIKVGVILPDEIYIPDVMGVVDVFGLLPNVEFFYVSDKVDWSHCLLGPNVMPTHTYDECPDVDILIIGATHPRYMSDQNMLKFIRRQNECAKAMISVCAGSLVFGAAGILQGKKATSNFHHTSLLSKFQVLPSHTMLERDGRHYSAGPAIGSYEIALQVVSQLLGLDTAHRLEQDELEYSPHPVFGVGCPRKASALLRFISKAILAPTLPIYSIAGKIGMKRLARQGGNHADREQRIPTT